MYKAKLCSFVIACIVGLCGFSPIITYAAETNTETVNLSAQKDKRNAFDEKMKKANEKWKSLTVQQKDEVYSLLENEMKAKISVMDKLVEFGVMDKEDAAMFKAHISNKINKAKNSGEIPLFRKNGRRSR